MIKQLGKSLAASMKYLKEARANMKFHKRNIKRTERQLRKIKEHNNGQS